MSWSLGHEPTPRTSHTDAILYMELLCGQVISILQPLQQQFLPMLAIVLAGKITIFELFTSAATF